MESTKYLKPHPNKFAKHVTLKLWTLLNVKIVVLNNRQNTMFTNKFLKVWAPLNCNLS